MANEEHLVILRQGIEIWNDWVEENPNIVPDLSGVILSGAVLSKANFFSSNFSGAILSGVILSEADLTGADLSGVVLIGAILSKTVLFGANLRGANLGEANLNKSILSESDLSKTILRGVNLSDAALSRANLRQANLSGANINDSDFVNADLSGANLSRTQALGADFTGAIFTATCLEDWNINTDTILDDTECQYIYLKSGNQERRPSSGVFAPGDFNKLFQKALGTLDLIFRNGVDWNALLISLEKLKVETEERELSIQAIENKNDGAFVVRVNVPLGADKAKLEKFLKKQYESALKSINEKYRHQLQAKDREIEAYRHQNTNLMEIARLMASRPINVEAKAIVENHVMSGDRHINTGGGNYIESNTGTYVQGNYINMGSDLSSAATQIQDLIEQLQKKGVTVDVAQEQVAKDIATQAQTNATVKAKLLKWGQSLGDATVSDVVKGTVKLAIRSAGIPLP